MYLGGICKMSTELSTELIFDVEYTPSHIVIQNEDQLARLVNATLEKYDNLVFKESDLADAKKARAELNNIAKMIDGKRKDVKDKYNEPLKAFEATINEYRKDITQVSQKIDAQVKEFESLQKKEREQIILSTIEKIATENNVDPSRIKVDEKWLNSTAFTATGKLTAKTEKLITDKVLEIERSKAQIELNVNLVKSYAEAKGLEADSWISFAKEGKTAAELFPKIDEVSARKLKEEQAEMAKEEQVIKQQAKPHIPNAVEMQKMTQEKQVQETEVIAEDLYTFDLKITGTAKQLSKIKKTIEELGVVYKVVMEE